MQISKNHYARAWYESLKESDQSKWPQISQSFLSRMQADGNLNWLRQILDTMTEYEREDLGVIGVKVSTAHEMPAQAVEEIIQGLIGSDKLDLTIKEDKRLLGGMEVRTNNSRWDLSMKGRINQLKKTLVS